MNSESGSEHDASELFYDSLDEDTEDDDSSWMGEMEESDASSLDFLPPSNCWSCGLIHHHRHIIPRKLLAYFPELKVDDPRSFLEVRHLCVMLEKIMEVLNGAANKKLGTYSTKYAKKKFHEKILLVKYKSRVMTKMALARVLPTFVPDLVVDRILHFMIETDDGRPGNYTFEMHDDEMSNTSLNEMYWKLADIYEKIKKLEEVNFRCEDCEEIVSIVLKFTLDEDFFSFWKTSDPNIEEEEVESCVSCQSRMVEVEYCKTHESFGNEVFDYDEKDETETDTIILD